MTLQWLVDDPGSWQWFRNVTCHDIYWDALQAEIDRIALLSLPVQKWNRSFAPKETAWPR